MNSFVTSLISRLLKLIDGLDAYRLVYDKEKVHKLVTAAEQMVSAGSKADVTQQQPTQRNYNTEEGDASSELTSGDESNAEIDTDEAGSSRKVSLNRTFIRPEASFGDAPVVMRNRQRSKAQRPWSLSAVEASSPASWALHSTSETRLDHLGTCGASGASGSAKKPFAGHVATQKDGASPNLNDGSAAALSSGGSTGGGVRQRRRRSSARFRTAQLMLRRGVDIDVNNFRSCLFLFSSCHCIDSIFFFFFLSAVRVVTTTTRRCRRAALVRRRPWRRLWRRHIHRVNPAPEPAAIAVAASSNRQR